MKVEETVLFPFAHYQRSLASDCFMGVISVPPKSLLQVALVKETTWLTLSVFSFHNMANSANMRRSTEARNSGLGSFPHLFFGFWREQSLFLVLLQNVQHGSFVL